MPPAPIFFPTPAAMRAWLQQHAASAPELLVGFHRRAAVSPDNPSLTWQESVAEALCFGWIDGVRTPLDARRYAVRFTPRRPKSKWSAVNISLIAQLEAAGKMTPAGRQVFQARKDPESPGYKAQKKVGELNPERLKQFQAAKQAWTFFQAQPPGYRAQAAWWVMHAKQEPTRDRRMTKLIAVSQVQQRLK